MGEKRKPPRRRIEASFRISADSWDELSRALHSIRTDLAVARMLPKSSVSGGYGSGWIIEASEDETVTHDSWAAELDAWLANKDTTP